MGIVEFSNALIDSIHVITEDRIRCHDSTTTLHLRTGDNLEKTARNGVEHRDKRADLDELAQACIEHTISETCT
jgi:hypothetical protein